MKSKKAELEEALEGSVGPHQRFLLRQLLASVDHFDRLIAEVNNEITRRLAADTDTQPLLTDPTVDGPPRSAREAMERLDTIPGVGTRLAEIVLSEVGRDVDRFPSAAHLASWAGLCPGHNQSGGKRLTGRTRRGSPALRRALVEAAHAAAKTRTYLGAQFDAWRLGVEPSALRSPSPIQFWLSFSTSCAPAASTRISAIRTSTNATGNVLPTDSCNVFATWAWTCS